MKMTTKMLAVAVMAVMAFAAFTAVGFASVDDADTEVRGDAYYTVAIDGDQFDGDGEITYDVAKKVFVITGTLLYDDDDESLTYDSWPLTVCVANSLWYQQSLTYVIVNGESYPLTEGTDVCYFEYDCEIVWDETKNKATLVIKDNSPVTKTLDFDMTGVKLQKFITDGSATPYYSELDGDEGALENASEYIIVSKIYTPSYNYGKAVEFGNGFKLVSKTYNIEIVDSAIIDGEEYKTKYSLSDVQSEPAYVIYKAYDGENTKYIIQKWNLAPIQIASITPSKDVEYNGGVQFPTIVVTDINGKTVPAEMYTAEYYDPEDTQVANPTNAMVYTITLATEQNNYTAIGVSAEWAITPYDLSKGDRMKLVGAENLVYNAKMQTVSIVLDKETAALYTLAANEYNVTAFWKQVVSKELVPAGYLEGTDDVDDVTGLTVSGIKAATHTIYFDANYDTEYSNFTSGIEGQPIITYTWSIAQKSITGSTLVWVGDEYGLMLKGSINYIDGDDYLVKYVSNDGQRVVDPEDFVTDLPYGTWYGMAYGVFNYTGVVMTATSVYIGGEAPVITISDIVKTDQGKSIRVLFSEPIDVDVVKESKLYVNYTTVKIVDGKHMNASSQIIVPVSDENTADDVASVYVTFDAIFTYVDVTLRYGYGPEPYAYDITNTKSLDAGSNAWSEKSLLTILDSYGNPVADACLKVDSNVYENGALIPSGLKAVSEFGVVYQDKDGASKLYDLVNYAILADGKVLFDGKVFVVKGLGVPTTKMTVGADKIKAAVGEVIKLTVTDVQDSNFTPVDVAITDVTPGTLAEDEYAKYIFVDTKNWTVSAKISCEFTVGFTFLNGITYEKTFKFGNGGVAFEIDDTAGDISVDTYVTIEGDATAYEGEEVELQISGTPQSVTIVDDKGNEINASVKKWDTDDYSVFFVMPAGNVIVTIIEAETP